MIIKDPPITYRATKSVIFKRLVEVALDRIAIETMDGELVEFPAERQVNEQITEQEK